MGQKKDNPRKEKVQTLRFEGRLTYETIGVHHRNLLEAVTGNQELNLDLSGATEVDLSFLQLVCAARRLAARDNKTLNLKINKVFEQSINRYGFVRTNIRSADKSQNCFWQPVGLG